MWRRDSIPSEPARTAALRCELVGCATVLLALAGCSLISLKSPERPLSTRDLNARVLTRELAAQFRAAVAHCAGDIAGSENDPAVLENSLRWEIAAVAESRRAETRIAPMMSLLDTWVLAVQMQAFMADGGAGGALFGTHQAAVRKVSGDFADGTQALARRLLSPGEYRDDQQFVEGYAHDHPLTDLKFERESVVAAWSRAKGAKVKLVDSLGTIPEAMTDAAERLQIYGDTIPTQVAARTQLALRQSGYSQGDIRAALGELDARLAHLSAVADSAPGLVRGSVAQLRQSLRDVLAQFDASTAQATQTLHTERAAVFADLQSEREAVVAAVDVQRKALTQDAGRIATQAVRNTGEQVRRLVRELVLLVILFIVVLLGLPFGAGYLVGRARSRRPQKP